MPASLSYPGDVLRLNGLREVVRPSCGLLGYQGACVSCGVLLPTRYYAELHVLQPGTHPIAILCPRHGAEATAIA